MSEAREEGINMDMEIKASEFLTVIVPAYNEEKWIRNCLQSLSDQTNQDFELIVVDNNSSDRTSEIAGGFTDAVFLEKNKGYHHAVMRGMSEAKGTLVAVCDADTVYDRRWVDTVYRVFDAGLVGVYGSVDFHDGGLLFRSLIRFFCFTVFMRLMRLLGIDVCNGFNFIFRRDAYDRVGGYDPEKYDKVGLDIDLGVRLRRIGDLRFIPKLKTKTSLRRILDKGLWHFLSVNLYLYASLLTGREVKVSYDDYNLR